MALSDINKAAKAAKADGSTDKMGTPGTGQAPVYNFFKVRRDNDGNFKDVVIQHTGFIQLLQDLGFRRYDRQDGTFMVVRLQNNIIEEVSIPNLRLAVSKYMQSLNQEELLESTGCKWADMYEKIVRSLGSLLSEEKLSLLVTEKGMIFNIIQDLLDTAFYFFRNGFVRVNKQGIKLLPYEDLPGVVWKDQILDRDYTPIKWEKYEELGVFYQFIYNVSANKAYTPEQNQDRAFALMTIAGYNLHRYFNTNLKATILLDARTSDEPDGRSGKSLFCKALRYILNSDPDNGAQCKIIDGKTFVPENRFKYEEIRHNTKLFILDDVKRGIQIEEFFNAIPDGISVERKSLQGKERVHTKILFTLNYTLSIRGGSAKDRVVEFEFADYYSSKFKPENEFKHWFFRDWTPEQWNNFDNLMMTCVELYLRVGLIQAEYIALDARKLKDETCPEFIDFMDDLAISHESKYSKKYLYGKFVDIGDDGKLKNKDFHWLKMRRFSKWLGLWAEYRTEYAGYQVSRSNGIDYIRYFFNAPVSMEYLEGATLFPGKSENCNINTEPTTEG
ncbi:MAG: hypothetical protein ACRC78_05605 [Planktothrix sp.]